VSQFLCGLVEKLGVNILVHEYDGYGQHRDRRMTESAGYDIADAAHRWLRTLPEVVGVTIAGYSIGTGIASYMATKYGYDRLILVSPFTSFSDLLWQKLGPLVIFALQVLVSILVLVVATEA
jgi:pimeloyl-ACP methyl ester carboxylesterase